MQCRPKIIRIKALEQRDAKVNTGAMKTATSISFANIVNSYEEDVKQKY